MAGSGPGMGPLPSSSFTSRKLSAPLSAKPATESSTGMSPTLWSSSKAAKTRSIPLMPLIVKSG